ncbi:MAG: hypothetical protein NC218_03015 [Acetobacter sp.]|nr:hypothetical protein [Acetobacter sp.]
MKSFIFNFIWAAICAWMAVGLLGYLNAKTGLLQDFCFPAIIEFAGSFGFKAKTVLFLALFLVFWATGMHKCIGRWLLTLIGVIALVIVAGFVLLIGYSFLVWMISLL